MAKMKSGYNNYHDLVCVQHDLSIFLPLHAALPHGGGLQQSSQGARSVKNH